MSSISLSDEIITITEKTIGNLHAHTGIYRVLITFGEIQFS